MWEKMIFLIEFKKKNFETFIRNMQLQLEILFFSQTQANKIFKIALVSFLLKFSVSLNLLGKIHTKMPKNGHIYAIVVLLAFRRKND